MADYGVRKYDSFTGRFMTADVLFEKYPAWNPYHYSVNNPITYRDGNGKYVETVLDVGFIVYDLVDIGVTAAKGEQVTATQTGALLADIAALAVPVTGAGLAVRAARSAKLADKIIDTKKLTKKFEARKLIKDELKELFGDNFHDPGGMKEILKKDKEIKELLKKTGDQNFDFYVDKKSKEVLLRGNKSGKYIKTDIIIDNINK